MNVRIYDNGGETFDQYTVIFPDGDVLGIGSIGNTPNGFCVHVGSIHETGAAAVQEGPHLGQLVEIEAVPEPVRRAIISEWRQYVDHLDRASA